MEELNSQSSFDRLIDNTTNPPEGLPDGIYTYPDSDALYKKENGEWLKKIGDSDYLPLISGNKQSRIDQLELKATPYSPKKQKEIPTEYDLANQGDTDYSKYKNINNEWYSGSGEIFTDYPGKEGKAYRFENGKWYEYSSTISGSNGDISQLNNPIEDPLRINALNKYYKKQGGPEKDVLVGYPGKEENQYKVQNGKWLRKTPENDTWVTITNEDSIKSLNNYFKKDISLLSDESEISKLKTDNEYSLNFNNNLKNINANFIGGEEEEVVKKLRQLFPSNNGWKFDETGLGDRLKVTAPNGQSETFILDNWSFEDDKFNANNMIGWMQSNNLTPSEKEIFDKYDKLTSEPDKKIDITAGGAFDITPMNITPEYIQKKARQEWLPLKSQKIKDIYDQYSEYISSGKEGSANISKSEIQKAQSALGALANDKETILQVDRYQSDIKQNIKSYKEKINQSELYLSTLNEKYKNGEIDYDQYKSEYSSIESSLINQKNEITNQIKVSDNLVNSINKSIGENYLAQELKGSFGGAMTLSAIKGFFSPARLLLGAAGEDMSAEKYHEFIKELVSPIWDYQTSLQYLRSQENPDLYQAAFSVAESLGAMAPIALSGGTTLLGEGLLARGTMGAISFYPMSYYEMKDELEGIDIPESDKVALSSIYGIVSSAFESIGMEYAMGKVNTKLGSSIKRSILKNVLSKTLPKNASKEYIEALVRTETKAYVASLGLDLAAASGVEGLTEGLQSTAGAGIKELYDIGKGTKFFNNEGFAGVVKNSLHEGYLGALGGGMVHSVYIASDAINRGARLNNNTTKLLMMAAKTSGISEAVMTNLKSDLLNGRITKDEAKEIVNNFNIVRGNLNQMPENLTDEAKSVSLSLMLERDRLNKEIEGKDPNLVKPQSDRITEINNSLQELSKQNAVQEPSTEGVLQREQEGVTETGGERGGMEQVVQGEEVTREGETKAVQEEVVIDKPVIQSNSKTEVDRVKSLSNDAEDGATFNLDGTKYEGKGLIVPVVSENTTAEELTPEMISDFVEEHKDKIGDNETVKVGIYKFPNSNQVSIDLNILAPESAREQAIEFGKNADQESLFDLSTFENVKTGGTGLNPVQFNNEQFREISKAFKEGRVPDVFAKQPTAQIEEVTITPETSQTVSERINKETDTKRKKVFTAVQKVLSAIPNSRIILHDNTDAFVAGVAKSANITNDEAISQGVQDNRGSYVNGDIHINLEKAGVTTVFHEAFHDLLAKKGMDNNALLDMAKGLKSVISDKALKKRLDDFVSNYEQGERAEEYTTELGAIMAEAQKELSTTKFQQFKTLVNKIAKKLGLPVVFSAASTAQDAVDFMNSMSGKLGRGEQIEVGKKVGEKVGNTGIKAQAEELFLGEAPKFKSLDDVAKYIQSWINENKLFDKSIEDVSDQEVVDKFSKHILNEIKAWESIKGSEYVGFYDEDIPQRLNPELQKFAEERYGRELTDEEVSLYHIVSAFASPSADPKFDSSKGLEVFDKYMTTGELTAYGTEQATIWDTDSKGKRYDTGKLKFDEQGNPVYKQVAKAYATTSLEKFNNIVNKFKGDVSKAVNWVLSDHSFEDASKMMDKPTNGPKANQLDENEYFTKENGGTGVFAITGAKLGSYILNRVGNYSTVTKDMWYARTLARLAGESLTEKGKAIKSPWASNTKQGLRKRKLADDAFKIVAKELGTNPADVQQKIWDFEKRLYEKLGAIEKSSYASEGFKSKAKEILSEQKKPSIKFQKTEPVAGNKLFNEPLKDAETIAKSYMKSVGMEYVPVEKITKLDENLSKRISDAYDKMKNDPNDPQVKKAYEAMAKETLDQYDQILEKGYNVEINNNEPYSSSEDMINDLRDNKRMKIFSTESGFGDEPITEEQRKENPLLRDSGRKDINGETLLVNDVFRFVHDFFGHAKLGNSFGPIGEENAWRVHSEMYSPEARKAMTSETRGQNSYVNFSGVNDAVFKKRDKARELRKQGKIEEADKMVGEVYEEMKFADQKVGLLPDFAFEEGRPSKIKAQKQSKEDAIQDAKDKYELSVEKRGKDHKTGVTAAIADLQKSDWYRDSDDTQREEAIREIKEFFGEKIKKAPSVAKVMGKTKQTAFVSDLAAAIRDQVKLQARSSRETAKDINDRRKALGESIKQVVKSYKGKITEKQLNAINRRIASVNLFNQEMVERVVDYVNKVMNNAEYAGKVNNAFAERRAIRRMMKSGNMTETVAVAKEFVQIDPSMVDDIDTYLEIAAQIRGAVKSSKRVKDSVSLKQIVNFGEAYEYIKPTLERQEEMMKNMRLAEYNDLVDSGVISKDMTLKEINKIINTIRDNADAEIKADEEAAAMEFLKDKLGYIKTLLRISPLKGYNPITGEEIQISERHSNMINNIIKSNLDDLSLKQMIDMVDSLNNFYENGAVGGLEAAYETILGEQNAKYLEKKGIVARPLKLYFNKKIGQIFGTGLTSLNELFNRMFVGVERGIEVMTKSGFADIVLGANKARRMVKDIQDRYVKEFGKTKDFFNVNNVYERGMLSFLMRNIIGNEAEVKEEFNRRVDIILQSYEVLKNGTADEIKMSKKYGEIIEKLDIKSRDLNSITSKANIKNLEAVNWWINEWSKHYSDLSDVSRSVYNTILGKDINYTPDRYKLMFANRSKDINKDLVERNSAFLINTDAITDTNESGVMIASIRPTSLKKGRYVNLDFDVNNIESLTGALVDINTAGAIRRLDSFFKSKSFEKIVPSVEDRDILTERVNKYIRRAKNKLVVPRDVFRNIDNALNTVSSVGTALGLGGVLQSVKQTVSVAISTAIQTGTSFNIYAGEEFNNWLNTTGSSVTNRGQESLTAIESTNKKLKSFNGTFDKAIDTYKNLTQWQLKLFLSRPDVFVARAAFKSYYEQYLKSNGYDVSKINWATWNETIKKEGIKELNDAAVIYADTMVSRQQNVSDERLAGELLASEDSARKLFRKVLLPFASFSINQRARLVADINALFLNWNNISPEDKAIAIKSIAGTTAEQGVFQMINFGIGMALYWVAQSITGHDDDDEEWKKRMINATKYPLRSLLADMTSPNPLADDAVIFGADELLAMFGSPSEGEIKQAIKDEEKLREMLGKNPMTESQINKFKEKYIKDNTYQLAYNFTNSEEGKYGMFSIAADQYLKLAENSEMATNGTFTDDYMGNKTTKYLTDKDKSLVKAVFYGLEVPYSTGAALKEMGQVANKTYSIIKKRALTENQYDTYKKFKKEFKREPQEWEMKMIKSTNSSNKAINELGFIQYMGGLSPKQGEEYLKVFKKFGENGLDEDDYKMIVKNKSAEYIINKYLK